ncbi:hypothetical protein [Azospirillum baldaniorum]|uniref:hypothetical protein n=1 Tax=Azospirillum baldaniorum TaxID=1064539 RepID=UPI001FCC6E16|nr:hypothetical protein [Azospirillum baldaniorum]
MFWRPASDRRLMSLCRLASWPAMATRISSTRVRRASASGSVPAATRSISVLASSSMRRECWSKLLICATSSPQMRRRSSVVPSSARSPAIRLSLLICSNITAEPS